MTTYDKDGNQTSGLVDGVLQIGGDFPKGRSSDLIILDDPTRTMTPPRTINTLTEDIYEVLDATKDHTSDSALAARYAMAIGGEFAKATVKRDRPREKGKLWASDIGKKCLRQAWYNFNESQYASKLDGHTKFKFLYGNILEEAVLYFAEEAGHVVTHPQYTVEHQLNGDWTIRGRIDAIVDGHLVDVKSTSSFGYKRYKDGITTSIDSFGYIEQLAYYSRFIDVPAKDGGFIWIDKQNGHIKYTPVDLPDRDHIERKANHIVEAVDKVEGDVPRGYLPEAYGKSGNEKLSIGCSYCPYKRRCWRQSNGGKGLRTFLYNQGPIDFTAIKREPKCPEVTPK